MNENWADTRVSNGILGVSNGINGMLRINNESILCNGTYTTNDLVISTGTSSNLRSDICSYTNTDNISSKLKPLKFLPL